MSPAIKISGRTGGQSKGSTRKSGQSAPAKRTNKRSNSTASKKRGGTVMSDGRVRRETTDDPKVIKEFTKRLKRAGDKRDQLYNDHKKAVQEVFEITREAMEAGVPTGQIVEHARISRQWLYKMGEHADRGENGNGAASKPAAKRGPGRPRKNSADSKPAAKKSGSKKLSIRTR